MSGKYPSSIYRVSLKAIIRNEKGEVLVVREKGDGWSFPGGGMDHGEDEQMTLTRELYEEVKITAPFTYQIIGTETKFVEQYDTWLMWLVYEVTVESGYSYDVGEDADEIAFKDPRSFEDDPDIFAQLIYKWALK
jgi:8-oxo-dGTP pyrophosphatase MutT (NUDIX family)